MNIRPKYKKKNLEDDENNTSRHPDEENVHIFEEVEEAHVTDEQIDQMIQTGQAISAISVNCMLNDFMSLSLIIGVFTMFIFFFCEVTHGTFYSVLTFALGAISTAGIGFIALKISTVANYKSAYSYETYGDAFFPIYKAGCVTAFYSSSVSSVLLTSLVLIYKAVSQVNSIADHVTLFERIAAFGLGAATVSLFFKIGSGIFAKSADVSGDLVSKLEFKAEEDDQRNCGVLADLVGDILNDSCGTAMDLYALVSETTVICLVVSSSSSEMINSGMIYFPILMQAFGIAVSMIVVLASLVFVEKTKDSSGVNQILKLQVLISAAVAIPIIIMVGIYFLPSTYSIGTEGSFLRKVNISNKIGMVCCLIGLLSGVLIGLVNAFFNSKSAPGMKKLINGCKSSSSINIILGLSYGYISTIFPSFVIAVTILTSFLLSGIFGIVLTAIGLISIMPSIMIVHSLTATSDNAKGMGALCNVSPQILAKYDNINEVADEACSLCKGFTIGTMSIISISAFCAFIVRSSLTNVNAFSSIVLAGLMLGAMLPYWISAILMSNVGELSHKQATKIREGFNLNTKEKSLGLNGNVIIQEGNEFSQEKVLMLALILVGLIVGLGVFFGITSVAGLVIGVIISSIQMIISFNNSGVVWDQLKNTIKSTIKDN